MSASTCATWTSPRSSSATSPSGCSARLAARRSWRLFKGRASRHTSKMPRMAEVLHAVNASVEAAVRGVFHVPGAALAHALHSYGKGSAAHAVPATVTQVSTAGASHASLVQEIQSFAYDW